MKSGPFALVEDGTSRAWLFLSDEGDAPLRGLDGTWSNEEVVMPDELADFRTASSSELSTLLQEAAASLRDIPSLSKAAEKASSFDFKDVSTFFNWEGRPAVIVEPADGSISAWFIRGSAKPGVWEPVSGAEVRDSGRPLSKGSFQEVFAKRLVSE